MMRLLLLLPVLFVACLDATPPSDTPTPFFDLAAYIDAEADRWAALGPVSKTTLVAGRENQKTVSNLDFSEELAPFRRADINRIAWLDRYAVDSSANEVTYRALDDELRTRLLKITRSGGEVARIDIENVTDGPVVNTRQFLTYLPGERYEIRATQRVVLMDSTVLRVLVERSR